MTARSISIRKKAINLTLSLPVQATLYLSLSSLILWTVYFSTYPTAHNNLHSLRHSTLLVGCH
ncbi:CbtB-domain containing protein [Planktothrix sp. FACHB-1355]|uniref:CbtB-domain containing protein n=2 Tax=Cyanophyceae TaxID=3028117 RepID=A0A926VEN2_9CYAN|nr:CbtB-domain containing protein [Aerosakkonema funiforme FACHB-1375]MBD3559602.1 CbtB-domain containing protein [Planktothrix sp. FACHB-1355]